LHYIPGFDLWKSGLLDWGGAINPLATGIKCSWKLTTVSPSYLDELSGAANGLESLMRAERGKSSGILNGIDVKIWDPASDEMIDKQYSARNIVSGKKANKEVLCNTFNLDINKPLISFIGRFVKEKGADLLAEIIGRTLFETNNAVNFLILGSGDPQVEWALEQLKSYVGTHFNVYIGYNEQLSHQIYAGSDFLLMPSRVEPCGLNQLYALRYGTVPMVRSIGGLKDTVIDFGDEGGYGIRFNHPSVWDVCYSVNRALELYRDTKKLNGLRRLMMKLDYSWDKSAQQYLDLYNSLK
ncbi:MAG TPA: glycosyltransferase, partial [Chitinophagaceae bacterium]